MSLESVLLSQRYEAEQSFNESLQDWMGRAPFLAIAFAIHLLAFFILAAIPWRTSSEQLVIVMRSELIPPPEDPFEEPKEPELEIPEELDPIPEDVEFPDDVPDDSDPADDEQELDRRESPTNNNSFPSAIGLDSGGGPSGSGSKGRGRARARQQRASDETVISGLEWLADHQAADGRWDADGFMHDTQRVGPVCDGAGDPSHDVGVTALATLAFLGAGYDQRSTERYGEVVRRALAWLREQQDLETGLVGVAVGHDFLYDHAIATLALCECLWSDSKNPLLRRSAERAAAYCSRARNPYGAWRYAVPGDGSNDTSVTGWMVFALAAARDVDITVSNEDFRGALQWLDEVTDTSTGRTGYVDRGGPSARPEHLLDAYPAERGEAMTAVAMLSRIFAAGALGEADTNRDLLGKGVDLLLERLPRWSDDGKDNDMYYWYYGSYAMFQLEDREPRAWAAWQRAMENAIVPNQRKSPATFEGSWDPIGPWGHSGGRVYSTATMVLCLEVYYRYGKILGARER